MPQSTFFVVVPAGLSVPGRGQGAVCRRDSGSVCQQRARGLQDFGPSTDGSTEARARDTVAGPERSFAHYG